MQGLVRCAFVAGAEAAHTPAASRKPSPQYPMPKYTVRSGCSTRRRQSASDDASPPIADVVDMTGDRWTGLVISTQYFGIHRFDDIQSALDIATNILTDRLRALVANGVFERRLYEMSPPRYEYWLTKKGKDLYPHALALLIWAEKWLLKAGEAPPVIVTHRQCDQPIDAAVVCSECRKPLNPGNVAERRVKDRKAPAA